MSEKYTIREVHVDLQPGVTVIADVSTVDGLSALLDDLKVKGMTAETTHKKRKDEFHVEERDQDDLDDSPAGRIEVGAGLNGGSLLSRNVLAFKDGIPQLLRPRAFASVTDAALVLLHAVETGLRNQSVDYESFKGLYDAQNLKSGTPLSMLMTNLRRSGYLDKGAYGDGRKLRLTAKGDKRAVEIIKEMIGQP
jgi:hypothetical protein